MRTSARQQRPPRDVLRRAGLGPGERSLAWARSEDGWLLGTRSALHVVAEGSARIPWQDVQSAGWDRETGVLTMVRIGEFGQAPPVERFAVEAPDDLLQLVRERITASIVVQQRVELDKGRGFTVIGRRPPAGGPMAWMCQYDPGVDPTTPEVVAAADQAVRSAQEAVGET